MWRMVLLTLSRKGKHLEGVFLERKFGSDNLYAIHKSPSLYFALEKLWCYCQGSLSRKRDVELTNKELLIIIKFLELSNQTLLSQTQYF